MTDPTTLALRDIHVPPVVGWWPPAPAWWWLMAAILLAVIGASLAASRWRRLNVRRAALAELTRVETTYAADTDTHACAQAVSKLARRLTLTGGGSPAARDEAWFLELSARARQPLPEAIKVLMAEAPYSPAAAAALAPAEVRAGLAALRTWLSTLRPQPRTRRAAV
jgi:hypothetical protein